MPTTTPHEPVFPELRDSAAFAHWRSQRDQWIELVRWIAGAAKVPATSLLSFATGTNLVVDLDGRTILKLFPPIFQSQFFSERAALRQLAGRLSVPIPAILAEGTRQGWSWLVMTKLDGVVGSRVWPSLEEPDKEALLERIGRTIAEVQSVPLSDELRAIEPAWPDFVARQSAACVERHRRQGLAPHLLDDIDALLLAVPDVVPLEAPPVILTGEWIPENLLLSERRGRWELAAVIDFGDVSTGWREYDLLGPSAFMCAGRRGRVRFLMDGFGVEPDARGPALRRRLLTLTLLHRASDLRNIAIEEWETRIRALTDLEELMWPF